MHFCHRAKYNVCEGVYRAASCNMSNMLVMMMMMMVVVVVMLDCV